MATVEERLAKLEGKSLPRLNAVDTLYEDYLSLSVELADCDKRLAAARREEFAKWKRLKMIQEDYTREEKAMLATDKRADGPNTDTRKRNAENLIYQQRAEGGRLHGVYIAMINAENDHQAATVEKEVCIDEYSGLRYRLRTIGNLAVALGV